MPETIIDLGKKVKSKYPGQYDDIDDAEVGRKVKAKFPGQYDDFTEVSFGVPADPAQRGAYREQQFQAHRPKPLIQALVGTELEGAGNVAKGFAGMVPNAAKSAWEIAKMAMTGNASGVMNAAAGSVKGIVEPFRTTARDALTAPLPTDDALFDVSSYTNAFDNPGNPRAMRGAVTEPTPEERKSAQEGLGANLAGLVVPMAIPKAANAFESARGKFGQAAAAVKPLVTDTPAVTTPVTAADVNKWMGVQSKAVEHGANPGQRLMAENLIGDTKAATAQNVNSKLGRVGKQLETKLTEAGNAGVEIDAQTPIYDAAARAKKLIGKKTDTAFQKAVDQVVDDLESEVPNLGKASPLDAHMLKKRLGKSINWGESADPVNDVMIDMYREINSALKSGVKEAAALQDQWGDLYVASKSLGKALAKDTVGSGTGAARPTDSIMPRIPSPAKRVIKKYGPPLLLGAAGAKVFGDILK